MPAVTPVNASTWLKAAEPVRMISTITAIDVVVPHSFPRPRSR